MSTETLERDLVTIEPKDALAVFTANDFALINPILDRVRREVDAFKGDVSTPAGRKAIKKMAGAVAKSRVYLEKEGKRLADEQKKIPKLIDATRRYIDEQLSGLEDEVRKPLDEFEAKEKARVDRHQEAIAFFGILASDEIHSLTAHLISKRLEEAEAFVIGPACEEFASEYSIAKSQAVTKLKAVLEIVTKREAENAELDALRRREAERQRADEEERLRKEGEERARLDAEADARAEKERADAKIAEERRRAEDAEREAEEARRENERLKADAEEKAKAAAAAERKRIEDEKAAKEEEQRKREANARHVGSVRRAAKEALMQFCGLDEEAAKRVVLAIHGEKIPNVTINY